MNSPDLSLDKTKQKVADIPHEPNPHSPSSAAWDPAWDTAVQWLRQPGLESWPRHLPDVGLERAALTPVCLSFFNCKTRIMTQTPGRRHEDMT